MDINKTRWSLLDYEFLKDVVEVMRVGLYQPPRREQRKPLGWLEDKPSRIEESNYFDALMRHSTRGFEFDVDRDEALHHYASVCANAMILWHHAKWRGGEDE